MRGLGHGGKDARNSLATGALRATRRLATSHRLAPAWVVGAAREPVARPVAEGPRAPPSSVLHEGGGGARSFTAGSPSRENGSSLVSRRFTAGGEEGPDACRPAMLHEGEEGSAFAERWSSTKEKRRALSRSGGPPRRRRGALFAERSSTKEKRGAPSRSGGPPRRRRGGRAFSRSGGPPRRRGEGSLAEWSFSARGRGALRRGAVVLHEGGEALLAEWSFSARGRGAPSSGGPPRRRRGAPSRSGGPSRRRRGAPSRSGDPPRGRTGAPSARLPSRGAGAARTRSILPVDLPGRAGVGREGLFPVGRGRGDLRPPINLALMGLLRSVSSPTQGPLAVL